jgi:copper chaperone
MTTLKFKTSINCGGCIAKVTPVLNQIKGIEKWEVDTNNPQKILSVETGEDNLEEIVTSLKNIGYRAELL